MHWAHLRRGQLDALSRLTPVILPLAATEQHGEHLPLATDYLIGEAIVERLNQAMDDRLLVLPTLRVGCSEHHMKFPGSLTLSHETYRRWVTDVIDSAVRHGFRRFLLFNSHGGNFAINSLLTEELGQRYPDAEVVMTNWWTLATPALRELQEGGLGSVGHACEFETSVMQVIAPQLVDMQLAEDGGIQHRAPMLAADLLHRPPAAAYRPFHELSQNGVYGKPSLASPEKGERVLTAAVQAARELIGQLWPETTQDASPRQSAQGL